VNRGPDHGDGGSGRRARGSAALPMLALVTVAVMLATLLVDTGHYLAARAQAATAADAAALAAAPLTFGPLGTATSPREEAAHYAAANGARLVTCACAADPTWAARQVTVQVEKTVDLLLLGTRTVHASATAEFAPVELRE
jgi:uncharacterized membrane protein